MDSYEINKDTCALVTINDQITKVVENQDDYFINKSSYEVMEDSCAYYGSSCEGRIKGTKNILGSIYKVPIIIEETNDIIFFPTDSIKSQNCIWISLNQIEKFEKSGQYTKVYFKNGKNLIIKMSVNSFEMQVLRANRLSAIINQRKK